MKVRFVYQYFSHVTTEAETQRKKVYSLIRLWKRESKWDLNEIMCETIHKITNNRQMQRIMISHAHSQLPIQISDGKSTPIFSFP